MKENKLVTTADNVNFSVAVALGMVGIILFILHKPLENKCYFIFYL